MNLNWWKAAGVRAIKTIAQTAVATIGTSVALGDVNWVAVGSASVLAGILSMLTSIAGLPEIDNVGQTYVWGEVMSIEENSFVTQEQCNERRNKISEDYENLKKRVDNHGKEIDGLNNISIRDDERLKRVEKTFDVLSKIMIAVVGTLVLSIIKGALGI